MNQSALILHVIESAGGAARRELLLRHGVTRAALQRAFATGLVQRISHGVYAMADCAPDIRVAAENGGLITCLSGAQRAGLWVRPTAPPLHLATHRASIAPVPTHRLSSAAHGPHPWVAPIAEIVMHTMRCQPELDALIVAESAVVLGLVAVDDLLPHFQGRRDARHRRLLDMIDPKSQSIVETILRYACQRDRLDVQAQAYVPGVGHLDLLIDGWLYVEVHGEKYHNDAVQWAEDLRRANVAVQSGLPLLQFTGRQVLYELDRVMAAIHAMLRQKNRF